MKQEANEAMEKRLSSAARQMIPEDMYARITQGIAQEERTMSMNHTVNLSQAPKAKRLPRWLGAATAACLLLVCGVFSGTYYSNHMMVDTVVDIDVNPGIEISTNKNDVVLGVAAINDDAEAVLDGMDLKNTQLKVAVNAIVGSMVQKGYLVDGENSILVTVRNDDTQRAAQLRNVILTDIDASLKDNHITASVVNQTVADNTSAQAFADQQGISFGKAVFILNLCAKDSSLDAVTLAKLSIQEIAALTVEKGLDIRDIVDYDADDSMWENIADAVEDVNEDHQAGQSDAAVSAAKAKEIALTHAGVKASAASFVRAELDTDNGAEVYEIEFTAGGMEYDYEINAQTGAVMVSHKEAKDKPSGSAQTDALAGATPSGAQEAAITLAKAKEAALLHAGVSAGDAVYEKAQLDADDGVQVYEIEFTAGGMEYDYEINAATGKVIASSKETADSQKHDQTQPTSSAIQQSAAISAAAAKETALKHAGVAASAAVFIKVELEQEDGVQIYEVEFCVGTTEYEYEINAATGSVIRYQSEAED